MNIIINKLGLSVFLFEIIHKPALISFSLKFWGFHDLFYIFKI